MNNINLLALQANNVTLSTVIRIKQNLYHKSVYPSLLPLMVQRAILRLKRRLTSEAGKGRGLKEGCSLLLLLLLLLRIFNYYSLGGEE